MAASSRLAATPVAAERFGPHVRDLAISADGRQALLVDLARRLGGPSLRLRANEDRRPVLRADVVALAVECGRIVDREEHGQQVAERQDGRIERDPAGLERGRIGVRKVVAGDIQHLLMGLQPGDSR